ncbi:MAG TPA: zinc ribbon domain-containing protein [Pyrinomonadaceae bacterium]|nr:zinc ribbon domain-containing protein [Pyrinomonadaceae bacterium]
MYCPNCSQEQISDEMRFCSRCGFSLIAVRDLVASGNVLVKPEGETPQLSCGQKRVRRATWMLLASLALALFVGFITAMDDDFAALLLFPFLIFVIGFAFLLYGVFIADKRAARKKAAALQQQLATAMQAQLSAAPRTPELYPSRMAPIESFPAPRPQTAEMVRPPSVTENTTRLLDE